MANDPRAGVPPTQVPWCEAYVIVDGVRTDCRWPKGHEGFHSNSKNVEPYIEWDGDTDDDE